VAKPLVAQGLVGLEVGGCHSNEVVGVAEEALRVPDLGDRSEGTCKIGSWHIETERPDDRTYSHYRASARSRT
jgi:hypothetical protein